MKSDAFARRIILVAQCAALLMAAAVMMPLRAAAQAAPLPIEYFTSSVDVGEMKISPDGKYVAFTTGEDARKILVFVSLDEQKVTTTIRAEEGVRIYDFYWVSATRAIYVFGERLPGRFYYGNATIRAVNRDGTQHEFIYGHVAATAKLAHTSSRSRPVPASPYFVGAVRGDERNILITETPFRLVGDEWVRDPDVHPYLTRLNVYDGSSTRLGIVPLIGPRVLLDAEGNPRFASGFNEERKFAVVWKENADAEWKSFVLPGFRDDTIDPTHLARDGRVYFVGMREGERYRALYQLDLASRDVVRVAGIPDADVSGAMKGVITGNVVGVSGYAGKKVYHWLDPQDSLAKLHASLSRTFADHEVSFVDTSDDGRRVLVLVRSDRSPGEYFLFDEQTKRADMLRAVRRDIDPRQMRPRESITVVARDGMRLPGFVTKPASPGPHPMVVMPHDGPTGRDSWFFDADAQLLANRGYAVLQINYRGSAGYGLEFRTAGDQKWGTAIQDDIADATRWAIDQKIADPERVCIFGSGFGGYSAIMNAVREPKMYRCAIANAGMFDLVDWLEANRITESGRNYLERAMGSDPTLLRAQSPLHQADRVEAAVLLIQRKYSTQVYSNHSRDMYAKLRQAKKRVELFEPVGEQGVQMDRVILERVLAFLGEHLK